MKFTLQRLYHTTTLKEGDYSLGFLTNEEKSFRSFVLEDTAHVVKINGVTRIPAGFYELGLRKEDTPLTKKHRESYKGMDWFDRHPNWYHIEILKIPNYRGVYIHTGNDDSHTLGCLLLIYAFDISLLNNPGSKSRAAVNDFYAIVYPILRDGGKVSLVIEDDK